MKKKRLTLAEHAQKYGMKKCVVCRDYFVVRRNARTADTRTLCPKCRQVFSISDAV